MGPGVLRASGLGGSDIAALRPPFNNTDVGDVHIGVDAKASCTCPEIPENGNVEGEERQVSVWESESMMVVAG